MSVAMSSNEAETVTRKISFNEYEKRDPTFSLDDFYEIPRCTDWIKSNCFSLIGLQFPDCLLEDSVDVVEALRNNTNKEMNIIADSHKSCCVEHLDAKRVPFDAIIHFGHACLSPVISLPVLYVFGKSCIDIKSATDAFKSQFTDINSPVIILYEVTYSYAIGNLMGNVIEYNNIIMSELVIPGSSSDASNVIKRDENLTEIKKCGRKFFIPKAKSLSDFDIFYIGEQNKTLTYFMLSFNQCQFYSYYPFKKMFQVETLNVNKHLRKRYYYIEKAKSAKVVGIVVKTVTVLGYDVIKDQLAKLVENAGKKVFTFTFIKFNLAGLANYPLCDVYVDVACMESTLVENRELYQPMITPYELEVALNEARTWTKDYITDFRELLPGGEYFIPSPQRKEVNADVSLVTGRIYTLGLSETNVQDDTAPVVATRDEMEISAISAQSTGEFLTQLSWRGLEQHLGETAIPKIHEGRKGIASAYEDELNSESK